MRVAILREGDPLPPHHGGAARTWSLARGLAELGHEVHVLATVPRGEAEGRRLVEEVVIERLAALPAWRNPFPHRPEANDPGLLRRAVRAGPDLAITTFTFAAPSALLLEALGIPALVDAPGLESEYAVSTGVGRRELPLLARLDEAAARGASGVLAVSDRDRQSFSRFPGARWERLHLVPNLGTEPRHRVRGAHDRVVWLGPASHAPNREALDHLVKEVMPALWRRRAAARLLLAGAGTAAWVTDARIEAAGEVDDLDSLFARAAALVVPVVSGGGSRVKVVDALWRGVPVVGTAFGLSGHEDIRGAGQLIADDAEGLAAALDRLLGDPAARESLGESGRLAVIARGRAAQWLEPIVAAAAEAGADPRRALGVLAELPGRWPRAAGEIPDWLAARPRDLRRLGRALGRRLTSPWRGGSRGSRPGG